MEKKYPCHFKASILIKVQLKGFLQRDHNRIHYDLLFLLEILNHV